MKRSIVKKLQAYVASSSGFLLIANQAQSQVIYTDIDPDIILDSATENTVFDIDNNGLNDFIFINSSFTYFDESDLSYKTLQDVLVGPAISLNAIWAESRYYDIGYAQFTLYFPYALVNSYLITAGVNWQTEGYQIMAIRTLSADSINYYPGCKWFNAELLEQVDHYLGIRFVDEINCVHYGWIRCSVQDTGRTLTIKDYAYEMQCDAPILAGDTVSYVSIESLADTAPKIYSFNNTVHIETTTKSGHCHVKISSVNGDIVYASAIAEQSTSIELNADAGIYFVTVIADGKPFVKKIFLK